MTSWARVPPGGWIRCPCGQRLEKLGRHTHAVVRTPTEDPDPSLLLCARCGERTEVQRGQENR